ncbi:MAG: hypothetical protein K0V04_31050 [Deltaproteobacteria bacterium]|nr:hypothetical protein [Deltaproteobacteria bacterium]
MGPTTGDPSSGDPTTDSGPLLDVAAMPDVPNVGAPDGSPCNADNECASGSCYVIAVLGGVCGECSDDLDCPDGGCTIANPIMGTGSVCNMGELGGGCETDVACDPGLTCESIISIPGVLTASTCSECAVDADCAPGMLCSPDYDVPGLSGVRTCIAPGAGGLGDGCDLDATGAAECQSGACAPADLMGLLQLGVCSECVNDADCSGGACASAEIDLQFGLTPATCI